MFALAAGVVTAGCEKPAPPAPPTPEVLVTTAEQRDVPVTIELVGQTKGAEDVEIRPRVEGYLEAVEFEEGTIVRRGQLLYRIDRKPLEALLANAQADLVRTRATLSKAEGDVKRYQPLVTKQAVSQQELDNALAMRDAMAAQVVAHEASVEKAKLDLGYTTISSPIDGLVGTTLVRAGSLVGRGESTLLTTVSRIDPILFTAGISEAEYLRIGRRADELKLKVEGRDIPVDLVLADGSIHPQKGRIDAVERAVDAATGTLLLQFRFPNPGGLIRPGQYGRARFVVETRAGALLVPQRAVQELQSLYNIAVVGPDNKLEMKSVTVGPRVGSLWVIEKGITASDRVVVEGAQRVRPGTVVTAKPAPRVPAGTGAAEPAAALGGR
jgi:membrane fusion protein (multidrug efflux system)